MLTKEVFLFMNKKSPRRGRRGQGLFLQIENPNIAIILIKRGVTIIHPSIFIPDQATAFIVGNISITFPFMLLLITILASIMLSKPKNAPKLQFFQLCLPKRRVEIEFRFHHLVYDTRKRCVEAEGFEPSSKHTTIKNPSYDKSTVKDKKKG